MNIDNFLPLKAQLCFGVLHAATLAVAGSAAAISNAETPYQVAWTSTAPPLSSRSWSAAADATNNIYSSGLIDTGGGITGYLTKIDSSGGLIWNKPYGTTGSVVGYAVTVDNNQSPVVAGYTRGSLDPLKQNAGQNDIFLRGFSDQGDILWTTQYGSSDHDIAYSLDIDAIGNIYIGGYTAGGLNGNSSQGGFDAFIAKHDASGSLLWVNQFGTSERDEVNELRLDAVGNIYVGGSTDGSIDGVTVPAGRDGFVAKFDNDGNQVWVEQLQGLSTTVVESIAIGANAKVYSVGQSVGLDGDTAGESTQAFVIEHNPSNGDVQWLNEFGTDSLDVGTGLAIDTEGSLFVGGTTLKDFNLYKQDAFLAKLTPGGDVLWFEQFKTSERDFGNAMTIDLSDNPIVAGYISDADQAFVRKLVVPEPSSLVVLAVGFVLAMRNRLR